MKNVFSQLEALPARMRITTLALTKCDMKGQDAERLAGVLVQCPALALARSLRICHLVASLQGSGAHARESSNMHSLTLHDVVHRAAKAVGLADTKPWTCKELCVGYLQFKRNIFPAVLAARRRAGMLTYADVSDVCDVC